MDPLYLYKDKISDLWIHFQIHKIPKALLRILWSAFLKLRKVVTRKLWKKYATEGNRRTGSGTSFRS